LIGNSAFSGGDREERLLLDAANADVLSLLGVVVALRWAGDHILVVDNAGLISLEVSSAVASLNSCNDLTNSGRDIAASAVSDDIVTLARGNDGILVLSEGNAAAALLDGGVVVGATACG